MTTDDDRIGYLAGDGDRDLDAVEAEGLDDVRALLADPSVWVEPDAGLEDAVVAAVTTEAEARPDRPAAGGSRRRIGRLAVIASGAAAAVLIVAVMTLVLDAGRTTESQQLAASLAPTELVPDAKGHATLTQTDSGWRIELAATGLPRLDRGRFYQAWLRNDDGVLVAIGSFNEPEDVVLWAGVSPRDFGTLTVTEEDASGDPGSSGRRVLVGVVEQD